MHAARGDVARRRSAYREAVLILTSVGSDRAAAEMWFELAGLLEDVDEFDAARDAYRSAAAASGIQVTPADQGRATSSGANFAELESAAAQDGVALRDLDTTSVWRGGHRGGAHGGDECRGDCRDGELAPTSHFRSPSHR